MKNKRSIFVFACSALLLGACSPKIMLESPTPEISAPASDKAVIVFMRTSFVAGGIGAEIIEIDNGELKLVGALPTGNKIAYVTDPGEKVFMAYGTAADFMIAKVEKGKTYYSIVRPNWGSGAFIPTPIRTDGSTNYNTSIPDFDKWLSDTRLLVKNPDAQQWFDKNREKYQDIYKRYWAKFIKKSDAQKQERTMTPADGM
jgi:hypothetical protein